ncbi:MAG: SDR family NAD(P)-dependent oxidoreductase [Clostridiales bacterium]|nr:SDR family NAD(P)-dependent oxidoreductase [Clostridiales bacterium]
MQERKVVLITGGAMGQGRAHALKYAENGFDVVLADMLDPEHETFQETISNVREKGAEVLAVKTNVCSTEDMEGLFAAAWEKFGRIDVVIANAGVINFGYTWELTDEQVEKVINIDLIGTWRTDKYAALYMQKQGFGRIINISSTSGLYGTPQLATYCMAKWGVLGLTKTLAKELKGKGITVNALCPTKVKTPMCETPSYVKFINELTGNDFKNYQEMYEGVPFLDVKDISEMVYWLGTSPVADKFTGREVALDLGTLL